MEGMKTAASGQIVFSSHHIGCCLCCLDASPGGCSAFVKPNGFWSDVVLASLNGFQASMAFLVLLQALMAFMLAFLSTSRCICKVLVFQKYVFLVAAFQSGIFLRCKQKVSGVNF